jgi:signal transducing adaptor molecule
MVMSYLRNQSKARDAVVSLTKRLAHKNVNVILYSLTVANALVQNCSITLKQEIASRSFLQQLVKLVNTPKTHITVKNRILDLIQNWAESFRGERSLDYMAEVYRELRNEGIHVVTKIAGHTFPSQLPPSPTKAAFMSAKEKEEEELQLAVTHLYNIRWLCHYRLNRKQRLLLRNL